MWRIQQQRGLEVVEELAVHVVGSMQCDSDAHSEMVWDVGVEPEVARHAVWWRDADCQLSCVRDVDWEMVRDDVGFMDVSGWSECVG